MSGLKKGYRGSSCACACGASAKFVNWREKTVESVFGDIRLKHSYYHCACCGASQMPWDAALRLGNRRVTAGAEEVIALAGLLTSFGQAAETTLVKLTGIRVSESTVRRVTEDAGEELAKRLAAKETFGPEESWDWQRDAAGNTCAYASIDHVSVPQQGPKGAKAESRMAAVTMIYNPQSEYDERQHPRGGCPVRFLAGLYELNPLCVELRRQAAHTHWDAADQQIAISDAGNGLEDFLRKAFPQATSILDFFHASEHVTALAGAYHPDDATAAAALTTQWCHQLKHEGGAALLAAWEQLDVHRWRGWRSETYREQVQYFRNHQHRMDYPRYLTSGWQIGSGPVESGCKRLVTQRLKGAGMRWKARGTTTMCHLRALLLSHPDQWDAYWTP
ncbi:MAG TPA: ISKra4 family transposase, partial [Lacunisphaera sp.]|nr:ISKra4 family transposase [Lacunisphaera sp.]